VIAISRREFALEVARAGGAAITLPLGEDHAALVERVLKVTDGALCDRVIECVGAQGPLDLAGELTRERGRLIIAGFHQDGPRQINMMLWNWRGLDVINAHERATSAYMAGMRAAIDAIQAGALDPFPLFTHRFALGELPQAFAASAERPDGFLKALVVV
jgi:threonine dehydrogenase-like Zn-dependent dehydrogenase